MDRTALHEAVMTGTRPPTPSTRGARGLVAALAAVVCLGAAGPSWAQSPDAGGQDGQEAAASADSETVVLSEHGLRFAIPSGWRRSPSGKGAAAVLVAAGESGAQLEIRVSDSIPSASKDSYFAAFHARLKEAGFSEVRRDPTASYGEGPLGEEIEYGGKSDGRTYRLVVWQVYRDSRVWLVTAFFPADARPFFYEGFESLLASMRFQD